MSAVPPFGGVLERERELALIADAVERAVGGGGGLLLVEGAAGIGKTALLEEARRLAGEAGVAVLAASGGELEQEYPYGVVRQLFEPLLSTGDRDALLVGAAELAGAVVAAGAVRDVRRASVDSFGVLHGLYWLTVNAAARRPLLVTVDDVHWADVASLRFLAYLTRRLEGLAVALVLAARPAEPRTEGSLLAALWSQPQARVLRPEGLSERAVARLIEHWLGEAADERFVAACRAATGGIPFLVGALVGALAADGVRPCERSAAVVHEFGPATVAHATLLQLARLPAAAAPLARAVAVLGADARMDRAARLARLDEPAALRAVDALAGVQILRPGRPLGFVHPIVRAAVYDELPAGRRSALHAGAAELLADEGTDIDAVATHLLLTEPAGKLEVIERLRAAADYAQARGAPENATAYLRRALEEGAARELRVTLLHELATAEQLIRDPRAIEHLQDAIALADDPVQRARAARELAWILAVVGEWERCEPLIACALAELGDRDPELAVRLHTFRAQDAFDTQLVERFEPRLPELRALVEQRGPAARALALVLALVACLRGESLEQIALLLERGLDDGRFLADEGCESFHLTHAHAVLGMTEQLDRAERLAEQMLSDARARGSVFGFVQATVNRAGLQARRGNLAGAEADLRTGLELAQEHELRFVEPIALWEASDAIVERPTLDDVAGLAEALKLGSDIAGALALEVRGRLRLLRGDATGAIEDLRRCGQMMIALHVRNPAASAWRRTLALALSGEQREQALALARAELSDARRIGLPRAIGIALRTLGVIEAGQRGRAHLREAVGVLESSPARLEYARALVELGAALRRANQRAAARDPLRAGLDLAHRCGAIRLADHARTELAGTGAKPRREALSGVEALTPSERRIADMAAEGMSNPQIAQALFVTLNTVETHLRHIFQKLDINRRQQLADALAPSAAP